MASAKSRIRCPACGFAIFNRRVAQCESCKAALPTDLLFNTEDLARLKEEADRVEKIRRDMAKDAEAEELRRQKSRGDGG